MHEFDFSTVGENIELFFFTSYNLSFVKDLLNNLKLGYFQSQSKILEISSSISSFLDTMELMEDEYLQDFRSTILVGHKITQRIQTFLDGLGEKKVTQFEEQFLQKVEEVEDFLIETYKPGLFKILAILVDIEFVGDLFELQIQRMFTAEEVRGFKELIQVLAEHSLSLQKFIQLKKMQVKNFCLFLFKRYIQAENLLLVQVQPEFQKYKDGIVDFKMLMDYLSSWDSIKLKDLQGFFQENIFPPKPQPINKLTFNNQKIVDQLNVIAKVLNVSPQSSQPTPKRENKMNMREVHLKVQQHLSKLIQSYRESSSKVLKLVQTTSLYDYTQGDFHVQIYGREG